MRLFLGFLIGGGAGVLAGLLLSADIALVTGLAGAVAGVSLAGRGRRRTMDGDIRDGGEPLWGLFGDDEAGDSGGDSGDD